MALILLAPPPPATAEGVLRAVQKANWSVLVSRGGIALAMAMARLGKPLLVVESDPKHVEELQQQLAEEPPRALTVCCELLGPEDGEACWYRYNDSRRNGTTGPEVLQAHSPNLRLLSLELRPQRRLDAVLSAWEKRRRGLGEAPLDGPGVLVGMGMEALPVLGGSGIWIERFQVLHWALPRMGTEKHPEAWETLLQQCCLRESNRDHPDQGKEGWRVLEQDCKALLERKLQEALEHVASLSTERDSLTTEQLQLINKRDSLTKERDVLKTERDDLITKQQELIVQRDSLTKERNTLMAELDGFATKQLELIAQRDSLAKECDALKTERDDLNTKQQEFIVQCDSLTKERNSLMTELDCFETKQRELIARHDSLAKECDALKTERDDLNTKQQELIIQRDSLAKERNALLAEADRLKVTNHDLQQKIASHEKKLKAINVEIDQIISLLELQLSIDSGAEESPVP